MRVGVGLAVIQRQDGVLELIVEWICLGNRVGFVIIIITDCLARNSFDVAEQATDPVRLNVLLIKAQAACC